MDTFVLNRCVGDHVDTRRSVFISRSGYYYSPMHMFVTPLSTSGIKGMFGSSL